MDQRARYPGENTKKGVQRAEQQFPISSKKNLQEKTFPKKTQKSPDIPFTKKKRPPVHATFAEDLPVEMGGET